MDPRRARDPRLVKTEPQYAANPPSANPTPATTDGAYTQPAAEPSSTTPTQVAPYKPRPLFCVVCASNQVCT